ncbi:MAG: Copper-translocating P-type ATPase [Candidatus Azambacteria bacterium GW2011_GWA2_45_90]|uniref:Copper-translocating P-type ATPase n=1 Tax=Candidatus Azambacteria bacterium GW2011_GWA2_45_90 TaxID=1618614 RepID=A0A0G1N9T8_9BACT|nr:MAG: Copper-translocating P-type ATPase [Candidatus Azambacteria bacterium GW2011_GWA2_45_90]
MEHKNKIKPRIPVDGVVIFGGASVNESSVTGESLPAQKTIGDKVFGSTLNESGILKVRAERVGKESTLERMVELMKKAAENKSRPEKIADKFAALFLPVVALAGAATYFLSGNVSMTVAIFLVACADDIAVAIPLAMTAAIGRAAKRGVIIKGGEWLDVLSKMRTLVLDKTGTLTYGVFSVRDVKIEPGVSENEFWQSAAVAEKFSEHAVARAIFREAMKRVGEIPDPDEFKFVRGRQGEGLRVFE